MSGPQAAPRLRQRAGPVLRWLGVPVLLALLAWALRHVAWREMATYVLAASPPWLAAAIALQLVVLALWATLWRALLPVGEAVRFRRLLSTATLSGAAMLVTPSVAGQASAAALLARRCGLRLASAASILVGEQVAEAAAKAAVLLLALACAPLPPVMRGPARLAAVVFGTVTIIALVAARLWRRARNVLRHPRAMLAAVAVALCIKAVEAAILLAVQHSLGVRLGGGAILLLLSLAAIGIVVGTVLPVPGGVGIGEAIMTAGYVQLGLPLELGLALVGLHSATLLLPRLCGAGGLLLAGALRAPPPAPAAAASTGPRDVGA